LGDASNEIGFRIERATNARAFEVLGNALANETTFTDAGFVADTFYTYRVVAFNAAGQASSTVSIGLPPVVIDNDTADFTTVGTWTLTTGSTGYVGPNYRYAQAGNGSRKATWTFPVVAAGKYTVSAQWTAVASRSATAQYTIANNGTVLGTVTADQRVNGGAYMPLGAFNLVPGTVTVTLANRPDGTVAADAIRLTLGYSVTVDNGGPGYASTGTWSTSTSLPGYRGANYAFANTGTLRTATWTFGVAAGVTYNLEVLWLSSATRASNAPYTIRINGAQSGPVVLKDQRVAGGTFQQLGVFTPAVAGTLQVTLTNQANGQVVADGMRLTAQ
jgi:hypothetical protein